MNLYNERYFVAPYNMPPNPKGIGLTFISDRNPTSRKKDMSNQVVPGIAHSLAKVTRGMHGQYTPMDEEFFFRKYHLTEQELGRSQFEGRVKYPYTSKKRMLHESLPRITLVGNNYYYPPSFSFIQRRVNDVSNSMETHFFDLMGQYLDVLDPIQRQAEIGKLYNKAYMGRPGLLNFLSQYLQDHFCTPLGSTNPNGKGTQSTRIRQQVIPPVYNHIMLQNWNAVNPNPAGVGGRRGGPGGVTPQQLQAQRLVNQQKSNMNRQTNMMNHFFASLAHFITQMENPRAGPPLAPAVDPRFEGMSEDEIQRILDREQSERETQELLEQMDNDFNRAIEEEMDERRKQEIAEEKGRRLQEMMTARIDSVRLPSTTSTPTHATTGGASLPASVTSATTTPRKLAIGSIASPSLSSPALSGLASLMGSPQFGSAGGMSPPASPTLGGGEEQKGNPFIHPRGGANLAELELQTQVQQDALGNLTARITEAQMKYYKDLNQNYKVDAISNVLYGVMLDAEALRNHDLHSIQYYTNQFIGDHQELESRRRVLAIHDENVANLVQPSQHLYGKAYPPKVQSNQEGKLEYQKLLACIHTYQRMQKEEAERSTLTANDPNSEQYHRTHFQDFNQALLEYVSEENKRREYRNLYPDLDKRAKETTFYMGALPIALQNTEKFRDVVDMNALTYMYRLQFANEFTGFFQANPKTDTKPGEESYAPPIYAHMMAMQLKYLLFRDSPLWNDYQASLGRTATVGDFYHFIQQDRMNPLMILPANQAFLDDFFQNPTYLGDKDLKDAFENRDTMNLSMCLMSAAENKKEQQYIRGKVEDFLNQLEDNSTDPTVQEGAKRLSIGDRKKTKR